MTQNERRIFLIKELLAESSEYKNIVIPENEREQKLLLRALFNVRPAGLKENKFMTVQDEYLKEELVQKGITDIADLTPIQSGIYLWQGDITTLKCDAIVNAVNSALLGCFCPNHGCIDNCIHTFAGLELRAYCNDIMKIQSHTEETGKAKITPAFNLPCKYILHTVGPIISGVVTKKDSELLASCYRECLLLAAEKELRSVAFCCISTGEFHFPNKKAAEIAIKTVKEFMQKDTSVKKVIFNVFKDSDRKIYEEHI